MTNNVQNSNDISEKTLTTAAELYQFLDDLFDQDSDSDTLFAGGYLRGIISLVATDFGDENQSLSAPLIEEVTAKINHAKSELSPQDFAIVNNFWLSIQNKIVA